MNPPGVVQDIGLTVIAAVFGRRFIRWHVALCDI